MVVLLPSLTGPAIAGTEESGAEEAGIEGPGIEEPNGGGGTRPTRTFSLQFGQSSPDDFTSILVGPWGASLEDTYVLVASGSQTVWEIDEHLWLDGEVGISHRFGDDDEWEIFGLAFLRWDGLPWNDWLYTSLGVGIGPSFASGVSATERDKSGNDEGSRTLNMLVPEIALALPDHKDVQLIFRLHHRSGIFGLINDVKGGSAFLTAGVRVGF